MPENRSLESPLDLLQSARDELIAGTGPIRIVLSVDPNRERLLLPVPDQAMHRHSPRSELESQSAVLIHAGD